MKDVLFLHMGPGMNAFVERQVFQGTKKQIAGFCEERIYFWDQPPIHQTEKAFDSLVQRTLLEIERLYQQTRSPVHLIAHSFGGHLVAPLLSKAPDKIGDVHMISTGHHLPRGFYSLLQHMHQSPSTEEDLKKEIEEFFHQHSEESDLKNCLWEMIALIGKDPSFIKHYWPKKEEFEAFIRLHSQGPQIDMLSFQNLVNDFLDHHFEKSKSYQGPHSISILLGTEDPLLVIDKEVQEWRNLFPKAVIQTTHGGHFLHMEGRI